MGTKKLLPRRHLLPFQLPMMKHWHGISSLANGFERITRFDPKHLFLIRILIYQSLNMLEFPRNRFGNSAKTLLM